MKFVKPKSIKKESETTIYNIEQIPAEAMAVRLAAIDTILDRNPNEFKMYSNQYIPLIEDASIYERFEVQGKFDSQTSGGAILHINVEDDKVLNANQFEKMMDIARQTKTSYFAINYAYSECEKGHYTIGRKDKCEICNGEIVCQYTRVVGFITPVRSWNELRKDWEYPQRVFYDNEGIENASSQCN